MVLKARPTLRFHVELKYRQVTVFYCVAVVFSARSLNSSKLNYKEQVAYLLYSSTNNSNTLSKVVINLVIKLLELTGRFDKPLTFDQCKVFFYVHFILKYFSFSFLAEIILSLNIIIYIWLLFQENSRKFLAECDK